MTRDRLNLSLQKQESMALDRLIKSSPWRFKKRSTAVKDMLLYLSHNIDGFRALVTSGLPVGYQLEPTHVASQAGTEPAPKNPDPEKKKKKTKRRGGSMRGGQAELLGTDPQPTVEPFVKEVVDHLNEVCGTGFPPFSKQVRALVAQLVADGFTVDDIKAVNVWADKNWPRSAPGEKDWRGTMLVPSKLYGEKFAEHLGVARGLVNGNVGGADGVIPRDQIFGTPEFNARMGYDEPEKAESK